MYALKIKADATDIDVPTIRALIGGATIVTIASRNEHNATVSIAIGAILLIIGYFLDILLVKKKMDSLLLVVAVAMLTVIAKHEIYTAIIIMVVAFVIRFSYIQPTVEIAKEHIKVKKTFHNKTHNWSNFNNIVLKDGLLTLDFKNNKVLQLELDETLSIDEQQFNDFCTRQITA